MSEHLICKQSKKMNIFLTGATGIMGMKGMKEILKKRDEGRSLQLTVLVRQSKVNRKKMIPFIERGVKVIWGDLLESKAIEEGIEEADIVLHVGGMVSPMADWYPEMTYKVNTGAMRNIIEASCRKEAKGGSIKVVYIGSVAQYGNRPYPVQWGRTGDPIAPASFDAYALSKCMAEIELAESGLKEWVSIRQTGILHPGLLGKADDPIAFHVPMATGIEWVTDDDSGRLLAALCSEELPAEFWNNFYNVGGGESYRLSNYDFVKATLEAVGCPTPEKVFDLNWFAIKNFHGIYYQDSDLLDEFLHFRSGESFEEYMKRLKKALPFYFRLAPLAPASLIKLVMKGVANKKPLGTQWWIKNNETKRIEAAYGSMEQYESIPDWTGFQLPPLKKRGVKLDHGYDEKVSLDSLTISDLQKAAKFRGGELLDVKKTDSDSKVVWRCSEGHEFRMTPRTVLKGGHWCPECLKSMTKDPSRLPELAKKSPFLSQIVRDSVDIHS